MPFFDGAGRKELLTFITKFLLAKKSQPLVIFGDAGVGKTILLNEIAQNCSGAFSPLVLCGVHCSYEAVLVGIYSELREFANGRLPDIALRKLDCITLEELLQRVFNLLRREAVTQFIVLFDDAHECPKEAMRSLIAFLQRQQLHFEVVFMVDPHSSNIKRSSFDLELAYKLELRHLTLQGTKDYVRTVFPEHKFHRSELIKLHRLSSGLPERIDAYIALIVEQRAEQSEDACDREPVVESGFIVRARSIWRPAMLLPASVLVGLCISSITMIELFESEAVTGYSANLADSLLPILRTPTSRASDLGMLVRAENPVDSQDVLPEGPEIKRKRTRLTELADTEPAAVTEENDLQQNAVALQQIVPSASTTTFHHDFSSGERSLLEYANGYFVLQLAASPSESRLLDFVSNVHNVEVLTYRSLVNGVVWFKAVLADRFPDKRSAQQRLQSLPYAAQRFEPWIKSIGAVQAEIRVFSESRAFGTNRFAVLQSP